MSSTNIKVLQDLLREKDEQILRCYQLLRNGASQHGESDRDILEVALKELQCFGSQLRDGLCQELTGILMLVKGLTQNVEKGKHVEVMELNEISDLVSAAVMQARDVAQGLYPGDLEGTSLMRMLEELTANTQKTSGISCRFNCPKPILINESTVATHLYKIAREGIANAVKHGKPQSIEVSLVQNNGCTTLTIKDDGVGCTDNAQKTNGIGLKLAQHRSQVMRASFQMESNVPHGVILTCIL